MNLPWTSRGRRSDPAPRGGAGPGPPAATGPGPRVFTVGAYFNRPDRTNFYLGYRQIEPLQSRAVTAAVTYIFSPKYAMTFTTSYDFGTQQALNNSVVFTRIGTDLQVSLGFTYNALQNNFGALVEVVPNLVAGRQSGLPVTVR